MVEHGQALAYRKYSMDYVAAEQKGEAAKVGMGAGDFEQPWDCRAAHH